MGKYDDMLTMPHHQSATRPHMSLENRAAQFAPFAALTGYGDEVSETHRLTTKRIELDENAKELINTKLLMLQDCIEERHVVSITYFVPDSKKEGGKYSTVTAALKKINIISRELTMSDSTVIPINEIVAVTGDIFKFTDIETV